MNVWRSIPWKLILLYLTIVVSLLFMFVSDTDKTVGFPLLFDKKIVNYIDANGVIIYGVVSLEYYIFSIYQFMILIILTGMIAKDSPNYKFALWLFFCLMVVDMIDWICCYNAIWFRVDTFPVSMNIIKCLIFGLTILYTWSKEVIRN